MNTTLTTTPIRPGDNARDQLTALGIPAAYAARWAAMGPAISATLWTYSGHALLEAHRTTSAHRTIVDACLLDGGDAGARAIESARTWEVLIQALLDAAPHAPLVKAVTRDEGSLFEEALRSRGFTAAGSVGSPLSSKTTPTTGMPACADGCGGIPVLRRFPRMCARKPTLRAARQAHSWPSRTRADAPLAR